MVRGTIFSVKRAEPPHGPGGGGEANRDWWGEGRVALENVGFTHSPALGGLVKQSRGKAESGWINADIVIFDTLKARIESSYFNYIELSFRESIYSEERMTNLELGRLVSLILVCGHILLFLFGFAVAGLGRFSQVDIAQLVLMSSPLLVVTAKAGFDYVIRNRNRTVDDTALNDRTSITLVVLVTSSFIITLFFLYFLALFDAVRFSSDQIKIGVGVIETALAGYMVIIRDKILM